MRRNMKAERARNGLTLKQVATALGVHENAVARWEKEQTEPTASNLIALCRLYGCSAEYLLDLTDERTATTVV